MMPMMMAALRIRHLLSARPASLPEQQLCLWEMVLLNSKGRGCWRLHQHGSKVRSGNTGFLDGKDGLRICRNSIYRQPNAMKGLAATAQPLCFTIATNREWPRHLSRHAIEGTQFNFSTAMPLFLDPELHRCWQVVLCVGG